MSYKEFGIRIPPLKELEWKNVTAEGEDGRSWIVRERGGGEIYLFRAGISGRELDPLLESGELNDDSMEKAIAHAVRNIVCSDEFERIKKGQEYQVTVTRSDSDSDE